MAGLISEIKSLVSVKVQRKNKFVQSMCAVVLSSLVSTAAFGEFNGPVGIYSLDTVIDEAYVDGVVLRIGWDEMEKSEGVYDFSRIENTVRKAQAAGQAVTLTTFVVKAPKWLLQKTVNYDSMYGLNPVPWDTTMLAALEKLVAAQSSFKIDGVALNELTTIKQVDAAIGGMNGIRMVTLPSGYSAQKLEEGVFRSARAWASAYPKKNLFVQLMGIKDNTSNPSTAESLRDKLLAEFDGVSKPRMNFFIEFLTGATPTSKDSGKILFDVHEQTSIMMQACGAWIEKGQSQWSQCNWASNDSPEMGFNLATSTFNTTYFEIYAQDLQNASYRSTFEKWSSYLNSLNGGGSGGSDTIDPTVSISSPTSGLTVKGSTSVQVSASDNVGVTKLELYVNNVLYSSVSAFNGENILTLDTTKYADGNASLMVYAYDAAGNMSLPASVSVKISNGGSGGADTIAPTVKISNPKNGDILKGVVSINASATDNVGVAAISISIDGVVKKSSNNTGSISYSLDANKLRKGSHTILVQAKDGAGKIGKQSIIVYKK